MNPIKNVVFDLGGVLVDLDMQRCVDAFRRLGMPQIAEIIQPYYPAQVIGQLERGDITEAECCERMRAISGRSDITDEQIAAAYGEFLAGAPLTKLRQVEALRRRGIRTYVLSNNNPMAMRVVRKLFQSDGRTMEDYFDKIYLSHEMHALKPSPEIFRLMIADSGIDPAESLFIDDGPKNIETAHEMGFHTHLAQPGEEFGPLFDRI